ncbi:MAG: hypothetical protein HY742_05505 [Deltaproteobacteria bacterium]|nr:hypothetical protein [Deltaproteobacteria bacterium]
MPQAAKPQSLFWNDRQAYPPSEFMMGSTPQLTTAPAVAKMIGEKGACSAFAVDSLGSLS